MKLLAFKFKEKKCVVLEEHDQAAHGPLPRPRVGDVSSRAGGRWVRGGECRPSHSQGASPRGLQHPLGPLKYYTVT